MRKGTAPDDQLRTLRWWLTHAAARLKACGVESPMLEAQLLIGHVLGIDRLGCVLEGARSLESAEVQEAESLLERRMGREPMAYVLGRREFYGRDFVVDGRVLVPRPETELLVDAAIREMAAASAAVFADVGTGSGAVGITLALERPAWRGVLLDIDPAALDVARANALRLGASCTLMRADMALPPLARGSLDLAVCNPPYVPRSAAASLMPDVVRYEPGTALFSPDEGLRHLAWVIRLAAHAIRPGGLLLAEHGHDQAEAVSAMLQQSGGFSAIRTLRDAAGHPRCLQARRTARHGVA
jgi:release factor glutamine methyltransferase